MEALEWLRENGCGWDESTSTAAVRGGHLDVLKWLRENGCPWQRFSCLDVAQEEGHQDMFQWIRQACLKESMTEW